MIKSSIDSPLRGAIQVFLFVGWWVDLRNEL